MSDLHVYKIRAFVVIVAAVGFVYAAGGMNTAEVVSCSEFEISEDTVLRLPAETASSCSQFSSYENVNASDQIEICRELNDQSTLPKYLTRDRIHSLQKDCVVISQELDLNTFGD